MLYLKKDMVVLRISKEVAAIYLRGIFPSALLYCNGAQNLLGRPFVKLGYENNRLDIFKSVPNLLELIQSEGKAVFLGGWV